MVERLSIELTQRCQKGCWFCYSGSHPKASTTWTVQEVHDFVTDCARRGVRAVSFGGGEPLEFDGLFELLGRLDGRLFRSVTTNGLLLSEQTLTALVPARPDKVQVSIHFPGHWAELTRVLDQVKELERRGIRSGINLLVSRSGLDAARAAASFLRAQGMGNDRIVYLPMRLSDTPSPEEMGRVAGAENFQSMSCLLGCAKSPRFASIGWDRSVAWCSYTPSKRQLSAATHEALMQALTELQLEFCGEKHERLIRLSRRPQHGHDVVCGGQ